MLDDHTTEPPDAPCLPRPAEHDIELLRRLAAGWSVAAAGDELGLPVHALAARLGVLRAHYGVRSTGEAVERARALGHLGP